ncbi:23S rRNA pseudouridine(1911/1915/1917) synthase RluD [Marinicella gelatinilytica]|uniref:23S rRNA pseudouridine(1911/1915/1917) synthase RluD n=1 Tax=Marinicella gelatinilytica TaxID=2996017 RepID=UPI002260F487|nr:23S rRNA pseudouridine(1911/1915/1917) synthase RluD [Marinicella gelatinilytica]MCX7544041.1 23S rRNA pseudouridine(1911/1915/1917) synthase RluD [Marinicella gelatinilytica]
MNEKTQHIEKTFNAESNDAGTRIDQYLSAQFPNFSRNTIQQWIKQNAVKIDGHNTKSKHIIKGFETITVAVTIEQAIADKPQDMALDIRYEDSHLMIINKPAGLVVHPGSGNPDGTLLNGLLAISEAQQMLPRAGIVHRLDKDTSGLMVVAKEAECQLKLIDLLKDHLIERTYFCIAKGVIKKPGTVKTIIGRHPTQRTKMAVTPKGKPAITHYWPSEHFNHFTALRIQLETGRTHQIRVHMHHLDHPLVGDPVYGNKNRINAAVCNELKAIIREFPRQALHAQRLAFTHPINDKQIQVSAPIPDDLCQLLDDLHDLDSPSSENDDFEVEYME